jgi:multicomponent Na+:H+ antiporter subunit F
MYVPVTIAILLAMLMALLRALKGPTLYDRILALNMFGTMTVILLGVMALMAERPDFLDIAMIYALMNFIGTTAVLKFFRYGHLGRTGHEPEGPR